MKINICLSPSSKEDCNYLTLPTFINIIFQFCNVTEVTVIHKTIYPDLAILKINKSKHPYIYILATCLNQV